MDSEATRPVDDTRLLPEHDGRRVVRLIQTHRLFYRNGSEDFEVEKKPFATYHGALTAGKERYGRGRFFIESQCVDRNGDWVDYIPCRAEQLDIRPQRKPLPVVKDFIPPDVNEDPQIVISPAFLERVFG